MKLFYKGKEVSFMCACSDAPKEEYQWWSPKMTSNTSDGYIATASSSL